MLKKRIIIALAAVAIAVVPTMGAPRAHAAGPNVTIDGLTFATQTNGCGDGTAAKVIPVYGSSALKGFILAEAAQYCNTFTDKTNAPDVEYNSTGDSCPGVNFAATHSGNNELGVSDVFAVTCGNNPNSVKDTINSVQVFNLLANCPGSNGVQNSGATAPCAGSAGYQAVPPPGDCSVLPTIGARQFPEPVSLGNGPARLTLSNGLTDWGYANGSNCYSPIVQQRTLGSGTRATVCGVVFGGPSGQNTCNGNSTKGTADTTTIELNDVCGPITAPGSAAAGQYAFGYATRSAVVKDTRPATPGPLAGCGIVQYNNADGYNQLCDPLALQNGTAQPYSSVNTDGVAICNGDFQAAQDQYDIWGYAHLMYNSSLSATSAVGAFVTFLQSSTAEPTIPAYGLLRQCKMNYARTADGGPPGFISGGATC